MAVGPEKGSCYCQECVAGKPIVQVAGSPPQQYSLPLGWCRFVHRYCMQRCVGTVVNTHCILQPMGHP